MENAIEVRNLTRSFSDPHNARASITAVQDMNIEVPAGTIVSLMGPSGCGKSVFMKILGGIMAPTNGTIRMGGELYEHGIPKVALRKVGFVFQTDNLQHWRTVEKNLMLPVEVMRLKGKQWTDRIDEMLELVGLSDYRRALPQELSGGMKQRVSLVRAMMHDPDIVLMDQPFGALDAITRRMLTFEFIKIWKKTGKTFLIVTNDIDEALLLSSRVYVMGHAPGTVVFDTPVEIDYDRRNQQVTLDDDYLALKAKLRKWTTEGGQEE